MFRGDDGDPGRQMFQADGRFNLILSLTARPPRSVGFNDYLFFEKFDVGIKSLTHGFCVSEFQITNPKSQINFKLQIQMTK